ncbi:MAG: MarR family transcriptional regulator [Lacunisphaera sp.]
MGWRWGINRSVAQVHALLMLSPKPLAADEICESLDVARSNVSTSLKELQGWGLIRVVHVFGDRREHFEDAEGRVGNVPDHPARTEKARARPDARRPCANARTPQSPARRTARTRAAAARADRLHGVDHRLAEKAQALSPPPPSASRRWAKRFSASCEAFLSLNF